MINFRQIVFLLHFITISFFSASQANPPAKPGLITGNNIICANSTGTYSVQPVANATKYNWTVSNAMMITAGAGTNSITVTTDQQWSRGVLNVSAENAAGVSVSRILSLRSVPPVPGIVTGPATLCAGSSGEYSIDSVSTAQSYNWYLPANIAVTGGTDTKMINVSADNTWTSGILSVRAVNQCGESAGRNITIRSLPATPGAIAGKRFNLCGDTGQTYSVIQVPGVTYNWSVPAGTVFKSRQDSNAVKLDFSNANFPGEVAVAAMNSCGQGPLRVLPVKGYPVTSQTITGNSIVCTGSDEVYFIQPIEGATSYKWKVPPDASVLSGQGTTTAIIRFGLSMGSIGHVGVKGVNACGHGNLVTIDIEASGCSRDIVRSSE